MNSDYFIQILNTLSYKPTERHGLENMRAMCTLLGNPQNRFSSIHVAGTNGKGSVSFKIAKSLEFANYRCGLFTSPHISHFQERIKVGDQCICDEAISTLLEKIIELANKAQLKLTYFEYCTLLAFAYFAQEQVDIAVIEVGLGGRLDATNVLSPLLTIITSISKDHTELLGLTEEAIAVEKGETIKEFTPVVVGPNAPLEIFAKKALAMRAPLTAIRGEFCNYSLENQAIAREALQILHPHLPVSPSALERGLQMELPCRFEKIPKKNPSDVTVILDVAHNPDGIKKLIQRLEETFPQKNFHFAFNFSEKKDIALCTSLIATIAKSIHILNIPHPRLTKADQLAKFTARFSIPSSIKSPQEILIHANTLTEQDVLVFCGSFFIMDSIKAVIEQGYSAST